MMTLQEQVPVAPHGCPVDVKHWSPEQQASELLHVCPAFWHELAWHVPLDEPPGMTQERPVQQSADAVHVLPETLQAEGARHTSPPSGPAAHVPEQHSADEAHDWSFGLQLGVPASLVPPSVVVVVGIWQMEPSSVPRHCVPGQQALAPASAPQKLPSAMHVLAVAHTKPAPPSGRGRHGAPLQHWSLNWQASPGPMQHGAVPV